MSEIPIVHPPSELRETIRGLQPASWVEPPDIPSPTPFWGLGFRFESIGRKFYDTYQKIREVWLIGPYLAWPFYFVSQWFFDARDYSWQAEVLVRYLKRWIDGLSSGNTFSQLLYRIAAPLWEVVYDPRGWLIKRIRDVGGSLYALYANANTWVTIKVETNFPFLKGIRDNPRQWLVDLLNARFPGIISIFQDFDGWLKSRVEWFYPFIYRLRIDPIGYIIGLINSRYPAFVRFLDNPEHEIYRYLTNRYPELFLFFGNPELWFNEKLRRTLGLSFVEYGSPVPILLVTILDMITRAFYNQLNWISNRICNIILLFI